MVHPPFSPEASQALISSGNPKRLKHLAPIWREELEAAAPLQILYSSMVLIRETGRASARPVVLILFSN